MDSHRLSRRSLLSSLVAAPVFLGGMTSPLLAQQLSVMPVGGMPPKMNSPLHQYAKTSGRYFGTAVRMDYLQKEGDLEALVTGECSHITPEIHLKWNSIEWNKGQYNFKPIDDLIVFSKQHDLAIRGHTLLWDQSTPDWAKQELIEQRSWNTISTYFKLVLERYQAEISDWDVINEPIDTENGSSNLRRTTFFNVFGPSYLERSLDEAREIAPKARLVINDYGFDYDNSVESSRRAAFIKLIERLVRQGAPISGVGVQAHLDLSKGPIKQKIVKDFLAELAATGVDVTITELDVKEDERHLSIERRDQRVADEVSRYLEAALSEPAVRGVVTWGITDRHSWLSEGDGAGHMTAKGGPLPVNRGLPYDDALNAKPMYWAIKRAMESATAVS